MVSIVSACGHERKRLGVDFTVDNNLIKNFWERESFLAFLLF